MFSREIMLEKLLHVPAKDEEKNSCKQMNSKSSIRNCAVLFNRYYCDEMRLDGHRNFAIEWHILSMYVVCVIENRDVFVFSI